VIHQHSRAADEEHLLVEGLGVGGGGRNVGIAGSLVRAGGELELVGGLEVGVAGLAVGAGVVLEVEKLADHLRNIFIQKQKRQIIATKHPLPFDVLFRSGALEFKDPSRLFAKRHKCKVVK
jgi:hypothetical protein